MPSSPKPAERGFPHLKLSEQNSCLAAHRSGRISEVWCGSPQKAGGPNAAHVAPGLSSPIGRVREPAQ